MTRVTPYIGFVGPNGEIFYHLFSGTEAVLELPAHSNVGVPGVWVFEVTQNVTGIPAIFMCDRDDSISVINNCFGCTYLLLNC